ncbi:hypothetical protein FOL47_004749 [Perkinsus chesapeaki]|uniref:Uncharacterized protein n=1 Tax=Perkinsus chesapeaki TaxID=330153 RepID=A0A7J6MYZ2_PERCH|nr:hypothetical protein FOL47_004749 [Perkinsus chesapeaki]
MFASRKVSRSHRRKRSAQEEEDVLEEENSESLSLDDLKALQRERSRAKGVEADRHAVEIQQQQESEPEEKDEEEWGLLKRTFKDTGARLGTEHEVDKHMEKWVNRKLVEMGHKVEEGGLDTSKEGASSPTAAPPPSRVAKVFGSIPEHLQHQSTTEKRLLEEANQSWSMGLVEVETDRLEELRAIERAEEAKMRFLEEASRKKSFTDKGGRNDGKGKDRAKAAAGMAMSEIVKRARNK